MALILKDEFQGMLRIVRESSVADIGFTDSLKKALNLYSLKDLSDEAQRQLIQAWLYPTNDEGEIDETEDNHYREMKEFFIENLKQLEFRSYMPFCSCCGSDKPVYIGMIPNRMKIIVSFAFCVNCRDEMMLKKNALTCDV